MGKGFDTTDWTLVRTARADDERQARAALARLCAAYWFPLYAFVRHEGYSGDDARDLVQGYFIADPKSEMTSFELVESLEFG